MERQLNVKLEKPIWDVIEHLQKAISEERELEVSIADVIRLGVKELAKRYPMAEEKKKT